MKKKLVLLIAISSLLASCKAQEANAIKVIKNLDSSYLENVETNYLIDITGEECIQKMESKQTFPLFFYSNTCSHCILAKNVIKDYAKDKQIIFNAVEYTEENYLPLREHQGIYFTDDVYTPRILFIKEGEIIFEVNSNKMSSSVALRAQFDKYLKPGNIISFSKENALQNYLASKKENTIVYTYETGNQIGEKMLGKAMNLTYQGTKDLVIIDADKFDNENSQYLAGYAYEISNGQINKTIDYTSADGENILIETLTSYFGLL